jgi:hypothetical protein
VKALGYLLQENPKWNLCHTWDVCLRVLFNHL